MEKVQKILVENGLRKTNCRQDILAVFLNHTHALAHADLEQMLGDRYDRVTLYRTLHTFEEKGLVHSINDVNGAVKYALCEQPCNEHHHQDNHIHFSCTNCNQTVCINELLIPELKLPEGYKVSSLHFSAQGVCKACSATTA
ncbi:Fur family transcriptional regulator [Pontibacter sp. SGAir0037]|uniref:Fur family transcriptional regulator n=1 Tax=Pontibacter sp. SGAir0037 TaxID=2571030 RepID=UPI0010CD00A2|nr:transcriptional repressor [Pontibacter sp. SGAir0037]QCR23688.1 transcriptional repressor [Pontibacter sp. SGAir0037]